MAEIAASVATSGGVVIPTKNQFLGGIVVTSKLKSTGAKVIFSSGFPVVVTDTTG